MGADDKARHYIFEAFGPILGLILGEVAEHIFEAGIIAALLKFWFNLSVKTAVQVGILVAVLSVMKKAYYKEDFYLAFAILLIFQDSLMLSWFLYMYITYFRGDRFGPGKRYFFSSPKFNR